MGLARLIARPKGRRGSRVAKDSEAAVHTSFTITLPPLRAASPPDPDAAPVCRICFDGAGELVAPCACRGASAHVHVACLERWAARREPSVDGWRQCGVCLTMYAARRPQFLSGLFYRPSPIARRRFFARGSRRARWAL